MDKLAVKSAIWPVEVSHALHAVNLGFERVDLVFAGLIGQLSNFAGRIFGVVRLQSQPAQQHVTDFAGLLALVRSRAHASPQVGFGF